MTDDLVALLERDPFPPSSPDLETIRRLGRRRRHGSRLGALAAGLSLVVLVAGVWAVAGGGDSIRAVPAVTQAHETTPVSAYEREVLAEIPGSYEVDGTVVLPATLHPAGNGDGNTGDRVRAGDLTTDPVAVGFDGRAGPGYVPTSRTERPYLDNAPKGSQVVVDPGPVHLGCLEVEAGPCHLQAMVKGDDGALYRLFGMGTETFLQPGRPMQLFIDDDYSERTWHASLVGGFDGTTTTRVEVETVDGEVVQATVDAGRMSAGDTLFWARLPAMPRSVTAYDARGEVVATHRVRSCSGGVDCEVR